MSLLRSLRRFALWLYFVRSVGPKWAKLLSRYWFTRIPGCTVDGAGALIVPGLGSPIPEPNLGAVAILKAIRTAIELHLRAGASFEVRENEVLIRVMGIQGIALSEVDIGVFAEVFLEKLYTFEEPGKFLVVDVGANIGAATLFFAERYEAEVESFELMPSTAAIARRNVALNPELAPRITLQEWGLSDQDGEFEIPSNPDYRPSNSLFVPVPAGAGGMEKVQVKDIAPVIRGAMDRLAGRKLVVKIDAEGAEYEIIDRLAETQLLGKIDLILLEWHQRTGKDPDSIRTALRSNGFRWTEREHHEAPVGFIGAYR